MSTIRVFLAAVMLLISSASFAGARFFPQDSGVKARLRGISAVSAEVAWASGRDGTVLRTIDGGKVWQTIKVPGAEALDFRDIEGFDADTAVILSIGPGEASRVYRTQDAGRTWQLALQNRDPRAFFDCMAFDGERGWMLGDPVDGRFQINQTQDGGRSWRLLADGPQALEGEAAFAASGTCIAVTGSGLVVVTGGTSARAHIRYAGDRNWLATISSKSLHSESTGYFSIAASNNQAVLVGGDYKAENSAGISATAGANEESIEGAEPRMDNRIQPPVQRVHNKVRPLPVLQDNAPPRGYRSGVACVRDALPCLAVGPGGVDRWDGRRWQPLAETGYDAIDFVGNIGWASGDAGRIARIEISE